MIYVYPAPGSTIYFPVTRDLLPDEGAYVPDTEFWTRRIRDCDVVVGEPPIAVEETAVEPRDEQADPESV